MSPAVPRPGRLLAIPVLAGALALSGCLDLASMADIAFPATIRGLPAGQPFVPLPVGSWVTEGGIQAQAIEACFAPSCDPAVAVGLFAARGQDATILAGVADDPDELVRALRLRTPARERRSGPLKRGSVRPQVPVVVSAERVREGEWRGFSLRIARLDGGHQGYGTALVRSSGGVASVLIVIGPSDEATRRVARQVAAASG